MKTVATVTINGLRIRITDELRPNGSIKKRTIQRAPETLTLKLKTMDTTTVMQIIKMLDAEISMNSETIRNDSTLSFETAEAIGNESWGLEKFRDYLQSYIEDQLSAAENQTEQ